MWCRCSCLAFWSSYQASTSCCNLHSGSGWGNQYYHPHCLPLPVSSAHALVIVASTSWLLPLPFVSSRSLAVRLPFVSSVSSSTNYVSFPLSSSCLSSSTLSLSSSYISTSTFWSFVSSVECHLCVKLKDIVERIILIDAGALEFDVIPAIGLLFGCQKHYWVRLSWEAHGVNSQRKTIIMCWCIVFSPTLWEIPTNATLQLTDERSVDGDKIPTYSQPKIWRLSCLWI